MDELINEVVRRTGISQDQAREAVNTVTTWVKSRLPEPMAGQFDSLLESGAAGGIIDQAGAMLGGPFGSKKP